MTEQKAKQFVDFSEANKSSDLIEQEASNEGKKDVAQIESEFTHKQEAENKLAYEQNITAHIPGDSTIADVK